MIDAHVHFRDWNQKNKETILHGLSTGLKAGFDIFFDMPNTDPAITTREMALRRLEDGKKAIEKIKEENPGKDIHYAVYLGLRDDEREIKDMTETYRDLFPSVCGLKLFLSQSTGNMGIVDKKRQESVISTLSSLGYNGVLAVHAEKESLFRKDESLHSKIRGAESEVESISDIIEATIKASYPGILHIAHISTKGGLELVREAKKDGLKISTGATPHHSLLTTKREGIFTKMNPPLRSAFDRDAVLEALFDSTIDFCESDHAPHTKEDKLKGAAGIPGYEGMLRLISFLRQEGMAESRINELFSLNAVKVFNFPFKASPVPESISGELIKEIGNEYPYSAWA